MYLAMAVGCIFMFFDPVWLRFIGCLLLGIPALMLLYRQMRPRLDAGAFIMEGRFRDLLGPCGVILDPDIFLGETAYTATLRLPLETLPMDAMRSRQDALLFLSALSLTMDASAHGPAIDQVLGGMHADAARIRRMLKVQSTLELRGSHGVVTMDGGREMGFFLLEDAPGDARRSFLSICGMIREQGHERRMTNEDRSAIMLLPEDTLLLACAEMNQVPSNLTFLGSMILHEIDTPHPDALEALSALEAKGIPVTYLQPEGTRYNPVQAMHIPLEPCDTTAGRFTVHASGEDRRFDLAFLSYLAQARGQVLYLMWCLCFLVLSAAGILLMPGLPIGSAVFLAGAIAAFLCINRSRPFAPDMPRRPFPFTLLLPDVILILALVFLKALGLSSQAGWAAVFSPILLFWTLRLQRGLSRHIFPVFPVLCALLLLTALLTGTSPIMVLYALFAGTLTGLVLYLLLPSLSFSDWAPFVTQDMVRDLCAQVRDFLHEHIRDFTSRLPFRHKEEKTEDQEEEDTVEEENNDEAGQ